MIFVMIAVLLGLAAIVWLWKVPIKGIVKAMEENGSSTFEAYTIISLLMSGLVLAVYFIYHVL